MRCLFLTPFPPYPPIDGGRIRMFELADRLALRHEVDILSLAADSATVDEAARGLRERGHSIELVVESAPSAIGIAGALVTGASLYGAKFRSRAFAAALDRRLAATDYDVVQCEYPYMGQFRLGAPRAGAAWILDAHNVEHRLSRRLEQLDGMTSRPYALYARRETRARRREEIAICRAMHAVVTVSEPDRAALVDALPGLNPVVVPNGVDVSRLTPGGEESARPSGLFIGKLDYRPNIDALRWFAEEILPRVRREVPDFEFLVIGSGDPRALETVRDVPGLRVVGTVADVLPYLHQAWVVPVPLRAGSGTRLKILEALAAGKAVVTTDIGREGLATLPDEHLLVANDVQTFAAQVVRLCRDSTLRRRIGGAGRVLVDCRYDWNRAVEQLDALYERLAGAVTVASGV